MLIKRIARTLLIVVFILLIPYVAMQFTDDVAWSPFDFQVAGALLLVTGLVINFILMMTKNAQFRIAGIAVMFIVFLLIWGELAVGILGTPFAGS